MRMGCLEAAVTRHFEALSTRGKILAEYIWIGGSGGDLRSKSRVLDFRPQSVDELPVAHFDGSSIGQAEGCGSTVYLRPRTIASDPFRGGDHILVLCETFLPPSLEQRGMELRPHPSNTRAPCEAVMQQAAASEPAFSIEQQYTLLDSQTNWPLGWPERASLQSMTSSYCAVGSDASHAREFAESHLKACLNSGIPITGCSSEQMRGQWSYKVGPSRGVEIADQLWLSRYILMRCSEKYGFTVSLEPKPVPGDWTGNSAFVKYSTAKTRNGSFGWSEIQRHLQLLEATHIKHLMVYGSGNSGGMHKSFPPLAFSWGLENRNVSVRIPRAAFHEHLGYYEDRRPAANMDPYLVTMMLVCSTLEISLPKPNDYLVEWSDETSESSRGSSAILSELDRQDSFAPETPPQYMGLLDSECSSCP